MCLDEKKEKQWILTWEEPDGVNVGIVFVDVFTFKFDNSEYPVKIKIKNSYLVNLSSFYNITSYNDSYKKKTLKNDLEGIKWWKKRLYRD